MSVVLVAMGVVEGNAHHGEHLGGWVGRRTRGGMIPRAGAVRVLL